MKLSPRHRLFALLAALIIVVPFVGGPGGTLFAAVVALILLGAPLFVVIGIATILCMVMWSGYTELPQFSVLIERIRTLADSPTLLAIPMFIMSGAVMSRGQIAMRLVEFAKSLIGWIPGGLAISAVFACMLFAAISGSSPATVVAIGTMMGPTLVLNRYSERFSHGLLASAGSLGILIPPSIPMIIYPIVNQSSNIEVEHLFASGFGPGLVMGAILMGFSIYRGIVDKAPRTPFEIKNLGLSLRDGFWALAFPVLVLGGIYTGAFNAIEASAVSVIYAVVVEVFVHRAIRLRDVPKIFQETGIFLGALLVIMVAALVLAEFLEGEGIPHMAAEWIKSMELEPWQFLIALNLLLLLVGAIMDILSAMFIFVPLLAPMAVEMGVDPMHFGIIFIVNLEIGYLTPPIGLNLFVASTLFNKSMGHIVRSVAPFIGLMLVGLMLITYVPALSVGLGRWIMGAEAPAPVAAPAPVGDWDGGDGSDGARDLDIEQLAAELERVRGLEAPTMADMTRESELGDQLDLKLTEARAELERARGLEAPTMADMQRESVLQDLVDRFGGDSGGGDSGGGAPSRDNGDGETGAGDDGRGATGASDGALAAPTADPEPDP